MLVSPKYFFAIVSSFLLSLPFSSNSQAPRLKFKHITNEQGLSNSTIECIFQDHRGFIWFGTRDGLNRYDGNQMVVYRYDASDTNSISDNYTRCIYEDKKNNLWVGTINGLNRFDIAKNTFTRFKHESDNPKSLSNNIVDCICQDEKENLWISTFGGGINLLKPGSKSFFHYRHDSTNQKSLDNDHVNYLYEDAEKNLWIGTEGGLNLFNAETVTFKVFKNIPGETKINKGIAVINQDRQGNLWLGTEDNGLLIFNYKERTFLALQHKEKEATSLSSNLIRSILIDSDGKVWIGSINGGLDLYDYASNSFYNYQNDPENIFSLSQRTVSSLFEDNQGNMWVGTHRGGVNLYMPNTDKFRLYRQEPEQNSLSYNDVTAFCEDHSGNIWIGTDGGGLNLFDPKKNTFKHYKYNPYDPKSIGSNEVLNIMEDSQGNLWIATWGGGLNLLNRSNGSFTRFTNNPLNKKSISSNYIQKVFEDSSRNLWVATYYGGVNLFDRKTKQFFRFTNDGNGGSMEGNNIVSINEDRMGNTWFGTDDGGLNCYHTSTKTFSHYFNKEEKIPDLRIIFIDSKGRLWIGQTGLYLFNPEKNSFSLYTIKAGLSNEFIKGITEDDQGNFWIATSNGITQFNPDNLSFKKYNTGDGLQGLEFEANSFMKTKEGQMFFGGGDGFNSFYPENIKPNTFIPPVYITDFQLFNQKAGVGEKNSPLTKDISVTKSIDLTYKQSTFSFAFASLNYTSSENNQFAYKLEGVDKDWNYVGNEHKASYNNVGHGHYIFRVKGSNNDGVWNENGPSVAITIEPPFWDTWWFKTLIFFIIIACLIWFYRFRRKLEMRKLSEQKKEEMYQVQLQFFTNISHEFRTPLSLILGPLEKLQRDNPQSADSPFYKVIYRNANRLLNLINELMDFRKSETGVLKLRVMPGNLNVFLQEIYEEFSELAAQKKITFKSAVAADIKEPWFDRQILEKITINLISNSFKYTSDGGSITVEILDSLDNFKQSFKNELILKNEFKAKKYFYIRVADNGIGISKESIAHLFERYYRITESHLGSGIGLAFVKSLTYLHKGSISVYSDRNVGTEIIIAIPAARDDYDRNERWLKNEKELGARLESIHTKYEHYFPLIENENREPAASVEPDGIAHILLVDDNEELRNFIKESLSPQYHITEAVNGSLGFEKAKQEFPDCIISDVMMPVMDGVEFCRLIKNDIATSHIPFIMLTAKDALESKIEAIHSGADFYFSKPVSMQLLELTVRNILSQKRKLKEKYLKDDYSEAKDLVHSTKDKEFIDELISLVSTHLINPDLDVDFICTQMGMSRTKLYQKIKNITGQSIGELVRTIRLKKAAELMTHQDTTITDVMYSVGIQTQSYFTKAFKKEFGKTPTQFLKELNK
jgi:ligand-binding sensor domain-containing protein/signal transduction histidine kinase/AraC-like DNA-binding protein